MERQSSDKTFELPRSHSTTRLNLKNTLNRDFHKSPTVASFVRVKRSALQLLTHNSSKPSLQIENSQISHDEIIRKFGPGRNTKNKIAYKRKCSPQVSIILRHLKVKYIKDFNKTLQFSKTVDDKNLVRLRMFDVELSKGLNLMYGLPFQKYNKMLMQDVYFQSVLINNELNVLKDRMNSLNFRFGKVWCIQTLILQLFGLISKENQQSMNAKIEETIGILKEIFRAILFEYGDSPSLISVSSFPLLPNRIEVTDEHPTFIENTKLFNSCTKAFVGSVVGYNILSRKKKKMLDLHQNLRLFQFLARSRLNINELLEETSFHQKYQLDKVNLARSIYSLNGSPSAAQHRQSANFSIAPHAASIDDKMWNEMMNAIAIGEHLSAEDEKDVKKLNTDINSRSFYKTSSSVIPALKKLEKLSGDNFELKRASKSGTESFNHAQFSNFSNIYESFTNLKLAPPHPKQDLKTNQKLKVKKAIEDAIRMSKSQSIVFELRKIDPDKL